MRIITEHHVVEPKVFFPALSKVLTAKSNLSQVRLAERVPSEDQKRIFLTWETLSEAALETIIKAGIPATAHKFEIIRIRNPVRYPVIQSVFPFSIIRPGGGVIVQGKDFGNQTGQFLLLLSTLGEKYELTSLQWGSGFAGGIIPADISGVPDQPAFLQIITAGGKKSNEWPVQFTATRVVTMLPGWALTEVGCGQSPDGFCFSGDGTNPFTIAGAHADGVLPSSGAGQDVYQVTLLNGWVFDHYEWGAQNGINGGPFGNAPDPVGQSAFTVDVSWFYDVWGSSNYELSLFVLGPAGMPFNY